MMAIFSEEANVAISIYANMWSKKKNDVSILRALARKSFPASLANEGKPCEAWKRVSLSPSSLKQRG